MSVRGWLVGVCAGAALAATAFAGATGTAGATFREAHPGLRPTTWQTAACSPAPVGYSSCLAHVLHTRSAAPDHTVAGGIPNTSPSGFSPNAIATAYGFATTGGSASTIAIVDAYGDPTITTDLAGFSSQYGLPQCTTSTGCLTKVSETGSPTTPPTPRRTAGWPLETSLDVEWVHALAPNAKILLVEAASNSDTDLFTAVRYAATKAKYVSMSWGGTEFTGEKTLDTVFAAPGVSFFAASGDRPSTVSYPATSPDVIAVGGTTLTTTGDTDAWKSETAWATAGGGCSRRETATAVQAAYPSYDQPGATCAGRRAVPDISLDANPSTGVAVYDTDGYTGWLVVGGTSAATAMVAGHAAETGQQVNAAFVYGSTIKVYNVTTGSNGHPCEKGYNLCTGLGSWNTSAGSTSSGSGGGSSGGGGSAGTFTFTSTAQNLTAAEWSSALTVTLGKNAPGALTVSVTTGSSTGEFSTASNGTSPSHSLTFHLTPGSSVVPAFYYEDTKAGTPTLTVSAAGWTSATQTETVHAGPLAKILVSPASATLATGGNQAFSATGYDANTNPVTVAPTWSSSIGGTSDGSFSPSKGASTTFSAGTTAGNGTISATQGSVHGTATITLTAATALGVTITPGRSSHVGRSYHIALTVTVTSAGKPVNRAIVALTVDAGTCTGAPVASGTGTTGPRGNVEFTFTTGTTGSYCARASASAAGAAPGSATAEFTVSSAAAPPRAVAARASLSTIRQEG